MCVFKKKTVKPKNKVVNKSFIRRDVSKEEMMSKTSDREAIGTGVACLFHKTRVFGYAITLSVAFVMPPTLSLIKFWCNLTHWLKLEALCFRVISCQDEYSCYAIKILTPAFSHLVQIC